MEQDASPTGSPVIPPKVVPWLVAFAGLAALVAQVAPPHTVVGKVSAGLSAFFAALGLASPGIRRQAK